MSHNSPLNRAAVFVAALLALAGAAPAAFAGTYAVDQCQTPSGQPAPVVPGFVDGVAMIVANSCATGGGYQLTAPDNTISPWGSAWSQAGWNLTAPAGLTIVGYESVLSIASRTGDPSPDINAARMFVYGGGQEQGDWLQMGGNPWTGVDHLKWNRKFDPGLASVATVITCYGPCWFKSSPTEKIHQLRVTLDDPTLPAAATFASTGLLSGGPQSGTRTLRFSATDGQSGIASATVHRDDGTLVATAITKDSGCTSTKPVPCPTTRADQDVAIDTTKLPEGSPPLELWLTDAGGNLRKTVLPTITIDNIPNVGDSSRAPDNGAGGALASAHLARATKDSSHRVAYKHALTLTGKLVDAAGTPISGATLDVFETLLRAGGTRTKIGTITTGADGSYAWKATTTASRTIEISYAPVRGDAQYSSTDRAIVNVRPRLILAATRSRVRSGGTVRLTGRLRIDDLARGVLVAIDAYSGGHWVSAGLVRTDKQGRFAWHRKLVSSHGALRFRAAVKVSADLPGLAAQSRPVRIRVG